MPCLADPLDGADDDGVHGPRVKIFLRHRFHLIGTHGLDILRPGEKAPGVPIVERRQSIGGGRTSGPVQPLLPFPQPENAFGEGELLFGDRSLITMKRGHLFAAIFDERRHRLQSPAGADVEQPGAIRRLGQEERCTICETPYLADRDVQPRAENLSEYGKRSSLVGRDGTDATSDGDPAFQRVDIDGLQITPFSRSCFYLDAAFLMLFSFLSRNS